MILTGAIARHERRVRLLFDRSLAPAALTLSSFYSIVGSDGQAIPVSGLVIIVGEPSALDLALGADLLEGVVYTVAAAGVPAQDGSATTQGSTAQVRLGITLAATNTEVGPDDITELLYGVDLVWTGTDYGETPAGDLATTTGPDNVEAAIERRLTSEGLPWDDTYGAKPRAYVDGTPGALPSLQGTLIRQTQADNRVKSATCSFVAATDSSTASATFNVDADLIGEGDSASVTVNPNAS